MTVILLRYSWEFKPPRTLSAIKPIPVATTRRRSREFAKSIHHTRLLATFNPTIIPKGGIKILHGLGADKLLERVL
jgi:hypothetical protein